MYVSGRPKVDKEGKSEITTGSDGIFKCFFSESHPPIQSIQWWKGFGAKSEQTVLVDRGKYVIQTKTVMSTTLQIKSVTINDADTYTCVAVNKYSEGIGSFKLSVGSKYESKIAKCRSNMKVVYAMSITIDIRMTFFLYF